MKDHYVPTAEFYSQIIDSLQDYSVFTVDQDLKINSWNAAATTIFQYESDEIIGQPFETIFTATDRRDQVPQSEIDIALHSGRSVDVRWHLRKDGSTFYADGLVFPLKNSDDALIGFVKILRDITERKRSEDAIQKYSDDLQALNDHKESVLAILSHDLRSPLAGIIQAAEYMNAHFDTLEPALTKTLLQEFHLATQNQLNMLDYLVEWARIKYAAEAFVPTSLDLVPCVTQVFENLKETAAMTNIQLTHTLSLPTTVYADEKMLSSILQNLVSNAIKHSHPNGAIRVSATTKEDQLIVAIADTGVGMSTLVQETLFEPQVKALSKAAAEHKGAGIGLLLVKGFLEKNGGKVWVESEVGTGSTFYFSLPVEKM